MSPSNLLPIDTMKVRKRNVGADPALASSESRHVLHLEYSACLVPTLERVNTSLGSFLSSHPPLSLMNVPTRVWTLLGYLNISHEISSISKRIPDHLSGFFKQSQTKSINYNLEFQYSKGDN